MLLLISPRSLLLLLQQLMLLLWWLCLCLWLLSRILLMQLWRPRMLLMMRIHARRATALLSLSVRMTVLIRTSLVIEWHASFAQHVGERLTRFQLGRLIAALPFDSPVPSQRIASWETFAADFTYVRLVA